MEKQNTPPGGHPVASAHRDPLHPNPSPAKRRGLNDIAEPRTGQLDNATAKGVRELLSAFPSVTDVARICSVDITVQNGQVCGAKAAAPFTQGIGGKDASQSFLSEVKFEHLRQSVPHLVEALLKETGQAQYIVENAPSLINDEWRIVVDVDCYVKRKTGFGLHKDSIGQTMFTVLAYTNDAEMPGPEYILNPPPDDLRMGSTLMHTLPPSYIEDLKVQFSALPAPTEIKNTKLKPNGFIGMVDELVYHSTPTWWHRNKRYYIPYRELLKHIPDAVEAAFGEEAVKQWKFLVFKTEHGASTLPPGFTEESYSAETKKCPRLLQDLRHLLHFGYQLSPEGLIRSLSRCPDPLQEILVKRCQAALVPELATVVEDRNATSGVDSKRRRVAVPPLKRQTSQDLDDDKVLPHSEIREFVRLWVMAVNRKQFG